MKKKYSLIIALLLLSISLFGQSNNYFSHGENWSGNDYGPENYHEQFYVTQLGDTVINSDTLIKLIKPRTLGNGVINNYFLGKNESGILILYKTNPSFGNSTDSVVIDYSRTDSITYYESFNTTAIYTTKPITLIDTVYFNGEPKKRFRIMDLCGQSDDDFVYEGVFGFSNDPFFDACFEYAHELTCYSINDSTYSVDWFSGEFFNYGLGSCEIGNLEIDQLSANEFRIYPNPVNNSLNISLTFSELKPSKIEIQNSLGQILVVDQFNTSAKNIDVSKLDPGVYFVRLFHENVITQKSFVKI